MHVEHVINNANRMLGFLRRNFSSVPSDLKLKLYTTLVRSKLEYACSIWDPFSSVLTTALESVQNHAARFVLSNYNRYASVSSMKATLGLPTLKSRRKYFRLNLFHKIFYTNPTLKNDLFLPPDYVSPRFDHRLKVKVPICRTNTCHASFLPQTSSDWNHLPASIAAIEESAAFKVAVIDVLF